MRSRRLTFLIVLLVAVSVFALWIKVDWGMPLRGYTAFEQMKSQAPKKEQVDAVAAVLQARFGIGLELSYSGNVDFESGATTWTYSVVTYCGFKDYKALRETLLSRAYALNWPWPQKIDFSMSCPVTQ